MIFGGIEDTNYSIKDKTNLSCVITHDAVGVEILERVDQILKKEVNFVDVANGNICLRGQRARFGWTQYERCVHLLFPRLGFNVSVGIISIIIRLNRLPEQIIRKLKRIIEKK